MGIGKRIKEARENAGLTQEELGKLVGVTGSAITNYEKETSHPKESVMYSLIEALGVDANYLFQDCVKAKKAPSISDEAMKIAARYEKLDSVGRGAVNAIMKYEESRMAEELQKVSHLDAEAGTMLDMIVYTNPSAAGIPLYAENDYERIEFPASEVPRGADFGVRISGDSMEPTIHNGTIVWVHIFMLDDRAVCKRYYNTGSGIELRSDNSKYDPIKVSEFERLGIVGRVLGYK